MGRSMRRGEIRWYRFQAPDKRRPVLVLSRSSVIEYMGEVTVAPITSRVREIPSEVPLSRADGMRSDCAVNLDHIQTVSKGRLGALIATLPPARMSEVRRAIVFALEL